MHITYEFVRRLAFDTRVAPSPRQFTLRIWTIQTLQTPWIQTSSATVDLKAAISSAMASAGVLHPRVFLGLFAQL
jgi:hypothetical protein